MKVLDKHRPIHIGWLNDVKNNTFLVSDSNTNSPGTFEVKVVQVNYTSKIPNLDSLTWRVLLVAGSLEVYFTTSSVKNLALGNFHFPVQELVNRTKLNESQLCVFCSTHSKQFQKINKIHTYVSKYKYYVECSECGSVACLQAVCPIVVLKDGRTLYTY